MDFNIIPLADDKVRSRKDTVVDKNRPGYAATVCHSSWGVCVELFQSERENAGLWLVRWISAVHPARLASNFITCVNLVECRKTVHHCLANLDM